MVDPVSSPSTFTINLDLCGTQITQTFRSLRHQFPPFPRTLHAVAPRLAPGPAWPGMRLLRHRDHARDHYSGPRSSPPRTDRVRSGGQSGSRLQGLQRGQGRHASGRFSHAAPGAGGVSSPLWRASLGALTGTCPTGIGTADSRKRVNRRRSKMKEGGQRAALLHVQPLASPAAATVGKGTGPERLPAEASASRMIRPCSAECAAGYPSAGLARSGRPP